MRNPNREVFEYHGNRTAECYNQFFNPNICHVCKSVDKGNLILCDQCCLISYCSEKHKKVHHVEHVEICKIIAEILEVKPQRDTRRYNDRQQWIQRRKKLTELIQQKFDRPIKYMNQVIMWSKSCIVCHQQAELRVCQKCFSANYCNEHAEIFNQKHNESTCDRFILLFNINIEAISGNIADVSYRFLPFVNAQSRFAEMLEFCLEYIVMYRRNLDWIAEDYVLSDYLSGPLTIYSGLKRARLLSILQENIVVIHCISTNSVDRKVGTAWEILFHLVPEILEIIIVLIGPELKWGSNRYELCYHCKKKEKILMRCTVPLSYCTFVTSFPKIKKPNMIVGFHAGLSEGDTWSESIRIMQIRSCPLLLGFSCEQEARKDITKIQQILGTSVEPIFNQRNHFGGLVPHRDLETGDIYFRNEHLLIYDTLHYHDPNKCNTSSCE